MSDKHTAGTWNVFFDHPDESCREDIGYIRPSNSGGYNNADEIAVVFNTKTGNQAANAKLIAAAPELLESLKFLFTEIKEGRLVRDITNDGKPDWSVRMMQFTMGLTKAQLAIAKATI